MQSVMLVSTHLCMSAEPRVYLHVHMHARSAEVSANHFQCKLRSPDLVRRNRCIGEIRMIPNVAKPPNGSSPPKLGGVAARIQKMSRSLISGAQTGWLLFRNHPGAADETSPRLPS